MQTSQSNEESPTDSEGEGQQEQHQNHRHRRWFTVLQSLSLVAVLLLAVYNHALIDAAPEETLATPWLVESEPFEPLAPCNEGGSRLHTGFDVNGNGMLDLGERMDTVVLCHGLRGLSGPQGQPGTVGLDAVSQRLETTTIPVGNSTCPEGGVMILSGLDVNFNEQLEHEETAMRLAYDPWPGLGNSSQALNYGALVLSPTQAWFIAHDGAHGHEWHRWSHGELSDDWIVIHR